MAEVYVTPEGSESGAGLLGVVILVIALMIFGFIAYSRGWFSVNPAPSQTSTIDIKIPTPTANPMPAPAPAPTPPTASLDGEMRI